MQAAMFRRRWVLMGLFRLGLMTMLAPAGVSAQPNVKIVFADPDVRDRPEIRLGEVTEIKFIAQASPPGLTLQWTCHGPGGFDGDVNGLSSIYLLPERLAAQREQVTITVMARDEAGNTAAQDSLRFTLLASEQPTPIPSERPTPTPTVQPTPTAAPVDPDDAALDRIFGDAAAPTPTPQPTMTPTPTPTATPSPTSTPESERDEDRKLDEIFEG
jgi:hypothetical protein